MGAIVEPELFRHEPLPAKTWNRLICVEADPVGGLLSCTLQHFQADNCPPYHALSYEWGDPTPRHTILINQRPRGIHDNLRSFLAWASRQAEACEYWWIDSLCLNQTDKGELSSQIARMGDIYSQAQVITIWLGGSESPDYELEDLAHASTKDGIALRNGFLQDLLSDTYWQRVWIIQEVVHAREAVVVCQRHRVDLESLWLEAKDIRTASRHLEKRHKPHALSVDVRRFLALTDTRNKLQWGESLTFWELLVLFTHSKSTLPVDAVYGLVGLATHLCPAFDPELLDIDYAKTPEEVFWDTLFEARPPWAQYSAAYKLLRKRLTPHRAAQQQQQQQTCGGTPGEPHPCEYASDLERYLASPRTSARHRQQARVCLQTTRAFCALRRRATRKNSRGPEGDGRKKLAADQRRRLLLLSTGPAAVAEAHFPQPSCRQDAVALGMSLGCSGLGHQGETDADSPWRCVVHREVAPGGRRRRSSSSSSREAVLDCDEGGRDLRLLEDRSTTTTPEPLSGEDACDTSESSACDWRYMVLSIPEAEFELEIPRKKGSLRIDWNADTWRFINLNTSSSSSQSG